MNVKLTIAEILEENIMDLASKIDFLKNPNRGTKELIL
jgi:hypothetical protein